MASLGKDHSSVAWFDPGITCFTLTSVGALRAELINNTYKYVYLCMYYSKYIPLCLYSRLVCFSILSAYIAVTVIMWFLEGCKFSSIIRLSSLLTLLLETTPSPSTSTVTSNPELSLVSPLKDQAIVAFGDPLNAGVIQTSPGPQRSAFKERSPHTSTLGIN